MIPRRPRPQLVQNSIIRILKPTESNPEWIVTHIPDARYLTGSDSKGPKSHKEAPKKSKPDEKRVKPETLGATREALCPLLKKSNSVTPMSPLLLEASPSTPVPKLQDKTTTDLGKKRGRPKVHQHLQARQPSAPQDHQYNPSAKIFESVTDVEIELDYLEAYRYYVYRPQQDPSQEFVDSEATASDSEGSKKRKLEENAYESDDESHGNHSDTTEHEAKEPKPTFTENLQFESDQNYERFDDSKQYGDHEQLQENQNQQQQSDEESNFQEQVMNQLATSQEFQTTYLSAPSELSSENDDRKHLQEPGYAPNAQAEYTGYPQYSTYSTYPDFSQGYNFDPSRFHASQAPFTPNFLSFPFVQNAIGPG